MSIHISGEIFSVTSSADISVQGNSGDTSSNSVPFYSSDVIDAAADKYERQEESEEEEAAPEEEHLSSAEKLFLELESSGFFDSVRSDRQEPDNQPPAVIPEAGPREGAVITPERRIDLDGALVTPVLPSMPAGGDITIPAPSIVPEPVIADTVSGSGAEIAQTDVSPLEKEINELAAKYGIETTTQPLIFSAGINPAWGANNPENNIDEIPQKGYMRAYNPAAGKRLGDISEQIARRRGRTGECLRYVNNAIERAYGVRMSANHAYQAADGFARSSKFTEVSVPRSDIPTLPKGAVVIYNRHPAYGNGRSGHIFICSGDGRGFSDHVETIKDRPKASYRVFFPQA